MPLIDPRDWDLGVHVENGVQTATNGISDSKAPNEITSQFASVEDTILAFSKTPARPSFRSVACSKVLIHPEQGNFIILLDSPCRENEGDLIMAAEDITPSRLAFMVKYTTGLICAPLSPSLADSLHLPLMVPSTANTDAEGTAYTVSVDALHPSMSTGISAHDRALTSNLLASKEARPEDFQRPGHLFPLRAREGGVRERRGHTEATVEFCRLAGKRPAGVLCELVEEGVERHAGKTKIPEVEGAEMRRRESCVMFGRQWGIPVCTIEALVKYLDGRDAVDGEGLGSSKEDATQSM